jgi:hypothetical protein
MDVDLGENTDAGCRHMLVISWQGPNKFTPNSDSYRIESHKYRFQHSRTLSMFADALVKPMVYEGFPWTLLLAAKERRRSTGKGRVDNSSGSKRSRPAGASALDSTRYGVPARRMRELNEARADRRGELGAPMHTKTGSVVRPGMCSMRCGCRAIPSSECPDRWV